MTTSFGTDVQGDLERLVREAATRRRTGSLRVVGDAASGTIVFRDGFVAGAALDGAPGVDELLAAIDTGDVPTHVAQGIASSDVVEHALTTLLGLRDGHVLDVDESGDVAIVPSRTVDEVLAAVARRKLTDRMRSARTADAPAAPAAPAPAVPRPAPPVEEEPWATWDREVTATRNGGPPAPPAATPQARPRPADDEVSTERSNALSAAAEQAAAALAADADRRAERAALANGAVGQGSTRPASAPAPAPAPARVAAPAAAPEPTPEPRSADQLLGGFVAAGSPAKDGSATSGGSRRVSALRRLIGAVRRG